MEVQDEADWIVRGEIARLGANIIVNVQFYDINTFQFRGGADIPLANVNEAYDKMTPLVDMLVDTIAKNSTNPPAEEDRYYWEEVLARQVKFAEIYDSSTEICVYHSSIPINTHITLTNLNNNRTIDVRIIGHINSNADHLYISGGVARLLGIYESNTPIRIEIIGR